jgi:hypothetical protein
MIDANYLYEKRHGNSITIKEVAVMKLITFLGSFILLMIVVWMPQLTSALEPAGSTLRIAVLHW